MSSRKFNYIGSEEFLVNIFLELLKNKKYSIKLNELMLLDSYYLESLNNDESINILDNTIEEILEFINQFKEYINLEKVGGTHIFTKFNILITNPEGLEDLLISKRIIDEKQHYGYEEAVKRYINELKNIA